jgi:hypothetical protein
MKRGACMRCTAGTSGATCASVARSPRSSALRTTRWSARCGRPETGHAAADLEAAAALPWAVHLAGALRPAAYTRQRAPPPLPPPLLALRGAGPRGAGAGAGAGGGRRRFQALRAPWGQHRRDGPQERLERERRSLPSCWGCHGPPGGAAVGAAGPGWLSAVRLPQPPRARAVIGRTRACPAAAVGAGPVVAPGQQQARCRSRQSLGAACPPSPPPCSTPPPPPHRARRASSSTAASGTRRTSGGCRWASRRLPPTR